MTEVALTDEQRQALVAMVVRGMARGEATAEQQALAEAGLILVKGPMMMPTPTAIPPGALRRVLCARRSSSCSRCRLLHALPCAHVRELIHDARPGDGRRNNQMGAPPVLSCCSCSW